MPQTIQIYRGTQNILHDTEATLFTNTSTGFATRLRVGYLSYTSNFANVAGSLTIGVIRAGGTQAVAIGGCQASTFARSIAVMPHNTFASTALNTTSNGGPTLLHASDIRLRGGTVLSSNSNANFGKGWHITDVMIGPSDVIQAGWFDNGGGTRACDVEFCYIGITET